MSDYLAALRIRKVFGVGPTQYICATYSTDLENVKHHVVNKHNVPLTEDEGSFFNMRCSILFLNKTK